MIAYDAHHHGGCRGPGCIAAGEPDRFEEVVRFAGEHGQHLALGLHPWWAHTHAVEDVLARLPDTPLDAIGEVGLDKLRGEPVAQEHAVRVQLAFANARQLPVVLHCVRAHDRLLALLRDQPPCGGLLHGWTGSAEQLAGFVALGLHVGFGPAMLRSPKIQRAAQQVPDARLLVESDAEEDGRMPEVVARLAVLRGLSEDALVRMTNRNAARLFPRETRGP